MLFGKHNKLSYYNINSRRYEPDVLNSIMRNNNCMLRGIFGRKKERKNGKMWWKKFFLLGYQLFLSAITLI